MDAINYSYSIPYLVFMIYLMVLMFIEFRQIKFDQDTRYVRWACMAGFLFFFGLRGFVYTDWTMYYSLFEKLPTIWEGGLKSVLSTDFSEAFETDTSTGQAGVELGFIYFAVFLKSIIPDYFAFVFVNSLIDVILLNVFLKRYSKYYALSFIMFLVFGGLGMEFNLLRNMKAILLFLISLRYIQEQRFLPFLFLNLIGFAFHSSALVFIPFYFILNRKWPKWLIWSIFIVGNIIFIMHIQYMKPIALALADIFGGRMAVKVKLYFVSDLYNRPYGLGLGYIERTITFLIMIMSRKKLVEHSPSNVIFINSFLIYFIIYSFFAEIMIAVERLSLLFVFCYWILYPEILNMIKESINKLAVLIAMIFYSTLKLAQVNSNIFARYDNVMFGIESFEDRSTHIYNDLDAVLGLDDDQN